MQIENFGTSDVSLKELDKVELSGFSISDYQHPLVQKYIYDYERYGKKTLEAIMRRSKMYLPTIKRIFKEKNIPEDLVYLPIIESGFNIKAQSWAGATGLWQFIYGTGIQYDLNVNYWYDQRKDLYKSTYAAAYHLRYLYKVFDNWLLALAAYNAGAGKIGRAMKRYETKNFWELAEYPYIRKETRHYPAKFIAALIMIKNSERYGLDLSGETEEEPVKMLMIEDATDLKLLAEAASMPLSQLKKYNTALLRWSTPPQREYPLYLPANKFESLKKALAKIPVEQRVTFRRYFISIGENLSSIAKKFSIPIHPIAEINKLQSLDDIKAGQYLVLPIQGLKKASALDGQIKKSSGKLASKQSEPAKNAYIFLYLCSSQDSLYSLARKFSVDLQDIMRWNNLKRPEHLRSGMALVIKIPKSKKNSL